MTQCVSLIIVTDHRLFGECLASVLVRCGSFTVQAVVQTAEEALQQIQERQSHIILIDVHLPHTMVLALTQQLTREFPHVRVLLLGVTEAETEIQAYVEAGAGGYVLKNTPFHELQSVIELVTHGETMCSPHIAHAMFARLSELAQTSASSVTHDPLILSARELEILQLIAEGWSNRQIADHLYLSPHTVKNHVHNILKKLRVQRRLEAIKYASERQWLKKRFPIKGEDTVPSLSSE
jgi:two-component system, NarL family, response regulator DegU